MTIFKESPKKIVVVGLGKSGTAAAQFLRKRGHHVIATDIDPSKHDLAPSLEASGIETEIGFHNRSSFERADLIIKSPGIPLTGEHFQAAIENGVPIRGEMDLACDYIEAPIVAVTGTNGKTTVTTLISEMLKFSGKKVFTGGNIGTPLITYPDSDEKADVVVIEVSSFQLDSAVSFSPDVALLLNITEDHLNRYPDFEAYRTSKWSIFSGQKENGYAILNGTLDEISKRTEDIISNICIFNYDKESHSEDNPSPSKENNGGYSGLTTTLTSSNSPSSFLKLSFSESSKRSLKETIKQTSNQHSDKYVSIDISGSSLKGKHNRENIEASTLAALCAGATLDGIQKAISQFQGLPHRTQYVATIEDVDFYNDSKATNVDAVIRAIESFDGPVVLILGGEEKDTDFSPLLPWIHTKVNHVVIMGDARDKIIKTFVNAKENTPFSIATNMTDAVALAQDAASSGDIVLLSPACASFDMYDSYVHRGEVFMTEVNDLKSSNSRES